MSTLESQIPDDAPPTVESDLELMSLLSGRGKPRVLYFIVQYPNFSETYMHEEIQKITVLASKDDTHGYELFFHDGTKGTGPPPHSYDWDESFSSLRDSRSLRIGFRVTGSLDAPRSRRDTRAIPGGGQGRQSGLR